MWGHKKTATEKAHELQELKKKRIKMEGDARLDEKIQHEKDLIRQAKGKSSAAGIFGKVKRGAQALADKHNAEMARQAKSKKKKDPFDNGLFDF